MSRIACSHKYAHSELRKTRVYHKVARMRHAKPVFGIARQEEYYRYTEHLYPAPYNKIIILRFAFDRILLYDLVATHHFRADMFFVLCFELYYSVIVL